jgi:hypothetical protein
VKDEPIKLRSSFQGWLIISSWSLGFNLLLTTVLFWVDGWLGPVLAALIVPLAVVAGMAATVKSKDSYRAGRTQGAIFGVIWNSCLTLWPLPAILWWVFQG